MIACVQVGEYFPLLQRSLHSFPRQQCHRSQGAGNHHHLPHPRPNQHHHYQVHHHHHHHQECPYFQKKKNFPSQAFSSWLPEAGHRQLVSLGLATGRSILTRTFNLKQL